MGLLMIGFRFLVFLISCITCGEVWAVAPRQDKVLEVRILQVREGEGLKVSSNTIFKDEKVLMSYNLNATFELTPNIFLFGRYNLKPEVNKGEVIVPKIDITMKSDLGSVCFDEGVSRVVGLSGPSLGACRSEEVHSSDKYRKFYIRLSKSLVDVEKVLLRYLRSEISKAQAIKDLGKIKSGKFVDYLDKIGAKKISNGVCSKDYIDTFTIEVKLLDNSFHVDAGVFLCPSI